MAKFWNWLKDNSRWVLNKKGIAPWMMGSLAGAAGYLFGKSRQKAKKEGEEAEAEIRRAGELAYSRGKMTPEEQAQYQGSFGTGRDLEAISRYQMGMGERPEGYQTGEQQYQQGGPLAQAYYDKTLAGVKDPYAAWESSLDPQLQQAEDYINRQAQGRGLLRSGMPIESMGRAGVELAIKSAQERMNARQQELQRGAGLSQYGFGLEQQRYGNLSNLYGQQQQFGQQAMGRQASQALGVAGYQSYAPQAALGSYYGGKAALQALPGQVLGAAGQAAGAYYGAKAG